MYNFHLIVSHYVISIPLKVKALMRTEEFCVAVLVTYYPCHTGFQFVWRGMGVAEGSEGEVIRCT